MYVNVICFILDPNPSASIDAQTTPHFAAFRSDSANSGDIRPHFLFCPSTMSTRDLGYLRHIGDSGGMFSICPRRVPIFWGPISWSKLGRRCSELVSDSCSNASMKLMFVSWKVLYPSKNIDFDTSSFQSYTTPSHLHLRNCPSSS